MSLDGYRSRFSCFVGASGILGGGVGGANCNYSLYSDGVEEVQIPFIPCDQVVPYDDEFVNAWMFDDPFVGRASINTASGGFYDSVSDTIADDGDFVADLPAERLIQVETPIYRKKGATFDISGTQQSRFKKSYTGNEGWFLPEFSFVVNMITPDSFSSDFEFILLMNDFNTRALQLKKNDVDSTIQYGDKANYATQKIDQGIPQTVIFGADGSGNYRIKSSDGSDLTIAGFGGFTTGDMAIGFLFANLNKVCNAIIHEIGVLPYWPTVEREAEIYTRSTARWFTEQPIDGNTLTGDNLESITNDGLGSYTIL